MRKPHSHGNDLRQRRKREGLCVQCGLILEGVSNRTLTMCRECADKQADAVRRFMERRRNGR